MRNRFIIGGGNGGKYQLNKPGGNESHSHNIAVNGHQLTVAQIPSHSHTSPGGWEILSRVPGSPMPGYVRGCGNVGGGVFSGVTLNNSGGNQPHNHSASSSNTNHLPPFYALCFVIKVV